MEEITRNSEIIELATRGDAIRDGCAAYVAQLEYEHDRQRMSEYGRYMTFNAFKAGFTAGSHWEASRKRWQARQMDELRCNTIHGGRK